tara:strand:+ start:354 stop:584 length:231 start_codon:yes stop_codon:yes gene_type:complete
MKFSFKQISLISKMISDRVYQNKENIKYCESYIEDQFLMEESKEEIEKNKIECQKEIRRLSNECQELLDIFSLLNG